MKIALLPISTASLRLPSLGKLRARVSLAARRARVAKATHRNLSRLSDRDLADIGISRGDIMDVSREAGFATN